MKPISRIFEAAKNKEYRMMTADIAQDKARAITYDNLMLSEEELKPIRWQLYHSEQPGYYIFKNFLNPQFTEHITNFWTKHINPKFSHVPYRSRKHKAGSKNIVKEDVGRKIDTISYKNYFWNPPADEVTYQVSFHINMLRNQIMARQLYMEFLPFNKRAVIYTVAISKRGDIIVPKHEDFVGELYDPRRLQCTLILSKHGEDYSGEGFILNNNQGEPMVIGKDVDVDPGDLIIWRYNNTHSVENIATTEGQKGFVRIIYPPDVIESASSMDFDVKRMLKQTVKNNPILSNTVLKAWRKIKK